MLALVLLLGGCGGGDRGDGLAEQRLTQAIAHSPSFTSVPPASELRGHQENVEQCRPFDADSTKARASFRRYFVRGDTDNARSALRANFLRDGWQLDPDIGFTGPAEKVVWLQRRFDDWSAKAQIREEPSTIYVELSVPGGGSCPSS